MPQIISTPEGWFRSMQRDLHIVSYRNPDGRRQKARFKKAHSELRAWFAQHLPSTLLSIIGPSEYSGFIIGGPSYLTVDFDQDGLNAFESAWGGASPWHIEVWSFADWQKRVDSVRLLPASLSKAENLRWWDTPSGILSLSTDAEGNLLSLYDGWWKLQQLFPEFAEFDYCKYPCGEFWPSVKTWESAGEKITLIIVSQGFKGPCDLSEYARNPKNLQRLKEAFRISENDPFKVMEGDW